MPVRKMEMTDAKVGNAACHPWVALRELVGEGLRSCSVPGGKELMVASRVLFQVSRGLQMCAGHQSTGTRSSSTGSTPVNGTGVDEVAVKLQQYGPCPVIVWMIGRGASAPPRIVRVLSLRDPRV